MRRKSERKSENKAALMKFIHTVRPYRGLIIFSILLAAGAAVLTIFIPQILGEMTNIAIGTYPDIDWGEITAKIWLTIGLFAGSAVLSYLQGFIFAKISAKYTRDLRDKIIEKIEHLPISYFDKHKFGDVLSIMTNDVDVIGGSLSQEITDITFSLTTLIGVMVMMLIINVPLSVISFIVVPISVIVVVQITRRAQKFFLERQKLLGALNGEIEEDYAGQIIIKSNSHEKLSIEEFSESNEKLTQVTKKAQILSTLSMPVTHIFTNLVFVAVSILGGFLTVEGVITIGALQAFFQYVGRFNRPITEIASTTATIQGLVASTERVFTLLAEPEEEPDAEPALTLPKVRGEVEFHDVCFSYDGKTPIIQNFSVRVAPGTNVAIVGPTGAGKTTIINLLMRFYEPTSGYITIDGAPIREMKRADVRGLFGMVLQDTWLFSGTVEDNLRYGRRGASLEEVVAAAKASNAHHVIEALSKGYKSEISEDSDNVSAGEKQLLTIARAMVANPPMMILDEATSNVDTRTEQLIQDSFEKLTKHRTSFVIAHRLSTIRNADLILVMRDGKIVESGNHQTLLRAGGFYAELYNSQFAEN